MSLTYLPPDEAVSLRPSVMDPISGLSAASRTLTPITMLSSAVRGMEGLSPLPSVSSTRPTDHRSQFTSYTHIKGGLVPAFLLGLEAMGGGRGLWSTSRVKGVVVGVVRLMAGIGLVLAGCEGISPSAPPTPPCARSRNLSLTSADNSFISLAETLGGGGGACRRAPPYSNHTSSINTDTTTALVQYLGAVSWQGTVLFLLMASGL